MTPDSYYVRLITGEQRGPTALLLRGGLTVLSGPYAAVVTLRNTYYDHAPGAVRRASAPVISVGNLVTGGTGKTPMVIWIVERLLEAGRRPAVLMRGYKAAPSGCCRANQALQDAIHGCENDEAREIRRRCPRADLVIDPDRATGATRATDAGADMLVMDDGFQHRRLARDLDVVLVDAAMPFGGGLLPRGMRREPVRSLARADLVVVTRADRIPCESLASLRHTLGERVPGAPVLAARHRPIGLCDPSGKVDTEMPVDEAKARRAWIFAAVANPTGFAATVEAMGFAIVGRRFWPDHHTWNDAELDDMAQQARQNEPDVILATEKDAVKLPPDWPDWPAPLRVVRVGIEFLDDDAATMRECIHRIVTHNETTTRPEDQGDDAALSTD